MHGCILTSNLHKLQQRVPLTNPKQDVPGAVLVAGRQRRGANSVVARVKVHWTGCDVWRTWYGQCVQSTELAHLSGGLSRTEERLSLLSLFVLSMCHPMVFTQPHLSLSLSLVSVCVCVCVVCTWWESLRPCTGQKQIYTLTYTES